MDCKITLAQTNPSLGNLDANVAHHATAIGRAIAEGSQIVLFPELSVTGYFLKDQTSELAMGLDAEPIQQLLAFSDRISIVVGFVERAGDGRIYNSVAFLEDGEVKHVHRKVHLVTYGMFDEQREFAAGVGFEAFDSKHGRFGVIVCEDAWHVSSAYQYFLANVDALLVPSCSPGRGIADASPVLESERTWETLLKAHALFFQTWVCYANRVGWEDGVCFSGGSRVVDPFGNEVAAVDGLGDGSIQARMTSGALERARVATPLRRDAKPWLLARSLEKLTEERS